VEENDTFYGVNTNLLFLSALNIYLKKFHNFMLSDIATSHANPNETQLYSLILQNLKKIKLQYKSNKH